MRTLWCLVLLAAGCAEPATPAVRAGSPCDYQLDDFAGGTDHIEAWWRFPGEPAYPPSGKPAQATLRWQGEIVARDTTTTDCLLVDMAGARADLIEVRSAEGACTWTGTKPIDYEEGFLVVEVPLTRTCG